MPAQSPPGEQYGDDDFAESVERTPLLPAAPKSSSSATGSHTHGTGHQEIVSPIEPRIDAVPILQRPGVIIVILYIIVFVASASGGFQNISMTRIFEDILCRRYYNRGNDEPIDEEMCKIDAIQSDLAYLFAIQFSLNAGVSVLTALPWGIAADKIGRRVIFAIGLIGMGMALLWIMVVGWFSQTLSPRMVWLSPIAYLLGGGNPVLLATINSMVVDIVPESERSGSFMRVHGASMVGNLISPALASILMASTGPWPPITLAFFLTTLPAFAIFLIPETLKLKRQSDDNGLSGGRTFKADLAETLRELKKSVTIFSSTSTIIILLITMLQLSLVQSTLQFLSQFASKRYHIPIAQTGYIQSTYGAAFIAVSFFILPFVSSAVLRPGAPAFLRIHDDKRRDLVFSRASYLVSTVAAFILGLSTSLPMFIFGLTILAFGASGEGFLKSIATLYVTTTQRTRLFTILGLAAFASDLWVSPALAALFSLGMRLGGIWIGLPYFGLSVLCVVMFSLSLFLDLPSSPMASEESDFDETLDVESRHIRNRQAA
ncbi:major facilitator superfamily domain-containing protein [Astrocystis sublimbata]|nr:major facilitator superfamily domain-containing protein [Astrocystis sublimbata]